MFLIIYKFEISLLTEATTTSHFKAVLDIKEILFWGNLDILK